MCKTSHYRWRCRGTPGYICPALLREHRARGAAYVNGFAADTYAWGVMLYTGELALTSFTLCAAAVAAGLQQPCALPFKLMEAPGQALCCCSHTCRFIVADVKPSISVWHIHFVLCADHLTLGSIFAGCLQLQESAFSFGMQYLTRVWGE